MLPPLVDRVDHLVAAAAGRRVLHVGCANAPYTADSLAAGTLLHDRLRATADLVIGVDSDRDALDLLAARDSGPLLHVERSIEEHLDEIPAVDLVVAGEVVEHVDDAGGLLRSLRAVMVRDGAELVITTINAYGALRMLQYAWPRRGPLSEPVHPDHVAYYSIRTLGLLCERQGLEVVDVAFYDLGPEHRTELPRRQRVANDLVVRWFPQLADGIIVRCRTGGPRPPASRS